MVSMSDTQDACFQIAEQIPPERRWICCPCFICAFFYENYRHNNN